MLETHSNFNQRAATACSLLAMIAIVAAAMITVVGLRAEAGGSVPAGPRVLGPGVGTEAPVILAMVSYENAEIRDIAEPALDGITYAWRDLLDGWQIQFLGPNGRVSGYTWSEQKKIEIFVKDDSTTERLTRILAHELGHAVDVTHNTGDERRAWLDLRGAPNAPWWPTSGAADFETGAGDFAEVFSVWEVGPDDYRSKLGPIPTDPEFQRLAALSSAAS